MTTFPAPLNGRVFDHFTKEYFTEVILALGIGDIDSIHEHEMEDGRRKLFVHIKNQTTNGKQFAAKLLNVETRKTAGESNVWPTRVVHGQRRDGSDMYYQVYKTPTLAERAAKTTETAGAAATGKIAPRIV
jgi:hypothetical protein